MRLPKIYSMGILLTIFSSCVIYQTVLCFDTENPLSLLDDLSKNKTGTETSNLEFKGWPKFSNGKLVKIEWAIQDGRPVSCHLSKDNEPFDNLTCTADQKMEFVVLASGFYQFYVLARTATTDRLEFSRVIDFRVVNQKPRIVSSTENLAKGFASNDFLIKFSYEHPIDCELYCKYSGPNENINVEDRPEFLESQKCLLEQFSFEMANEKLKHGANYSFVLYAVDELNNIQGLLVRFVADILPPTLSTSMDNITYISCGAPLPSPQNNLIVVTDNLDPSPKLSYQDVRINSCLVERIWTAVDHVNNKDTLTQYFSFQSNDQLIYDNGITQPCSNNKQLLEDIKLDKAFARLSPNLCQSELVVKDISPVTPLPTQNCGFSTEFKMKLATDCGQTSEEIAISVQAGPRELPIQPLDEQENVALRPQLRWSTVANVTSSTLYLRTLPESSSTITNVASSGTTYSFSQDLKPDTIYLWRLVFTLNDGSSKKSPFWSFKTRAVADLGLHDFKVSSESVIPGKDVVVNWQGINYGKVGTNADRWNDTIYGSDSSDPSTMRVLGSETQVIQLTSNDKYNGQFRFNLDERYPGKSYYLWLQVDSSNAVQDSDRQNNWIGPYRLDVDKPKLPNLVPKSIVLSADSVTAGGNISINVTVENLGDIDIPAGQTRKDSIVVSLLEGGNTLVTSSKDITDSVSVNGSYFYRTVLTLPDTFFGNAVVQYTVNAFDSLYETNLYDNIFLKSLEILPLQPDTSSTSKPLPISSTSTPVTTSSSSTTTKPSNTPESQSPVVVVKKDTSISVVFASFFGGVIFILFVLVFLVACFISRKRDKMAQVWRIFFPRPSGSIDSEREPQHALSSRIRQPQSANHALIPRVMQPQSANHALIPRVMQPQSTEPNSSEGSQLSISSSPIFSQPRNLNREQASRLESRVRNREYPRLHTPSGQGKVYPEALTPKNQETYL